MNDFVRCNKLTGVYWLQGTVDALKIKIRLKPPDDIISLPTFEEYTGEPGNISLHQDIEEFSFDWQQKRFSQWEVQRYRDIHNCLTEHELSYHELVNSEEILPSRVFSHVHQDRFLPLPQAKRKDVSLLSSCLEYLRLDGALGRIGGAFKKSASEKHLFTSQDDVDEEEEQWTAMHVVFDNSNYNEEGVVVKQEATLLSVYHNSVQNLVILSPDVNHLESNPYVVEACGDLPRHRYAVGVELGAQGASGELDTLLLNIHKKWEKKHKQSVKFSLPPLRVSRWFLALEVEAARGFPADNLYIEYHLKVPESAQCRDTRQGRTQVSGARRAAGTRVFHFGHLLELCLEAEAGAEVGPVHIYLEAISTDHWRRHRTEGYCYLALPLAPGGRVRDLRCVRPEERGTCGRRFFLGGCHLVPQLEVFSAPQLQGGEYTYTEAGSVSLRTSVVAQHAACAGVPQGEGAGRGAEALLRSAEAALAHYRRARARLALAAAGAAATRH